MPNGLNIIHPKEAVIEISPISESSQEEEPLLQREEKVFLSLLAQSDRFGFEIISRNREHKD
jgi:hypothetical protein